MKFKPGDKVVWFFDGQMEPPETVLSKEEAEKLYKATGRDNGEIEWTVSIERENEKPVYLLDEDGNVGWMPEDELHFCTPTMEVLYGKANHNLGWIARLRKKYNV